MKRYYPTKRWFTGFDIIFFWVARMMMMGLHFMKEVPFDTVYIHALVRDERAPRCRSRRARHRSLTPDRRLWGRRARFTLAAMAAQGRDIKSRPARRRLSQFRDQAVERGALRRDERRHDVRASTAPCDETLTSGSRTSLPSGREITGDRGYRFTRRRARLSLCGTSIAMVSRTGEARVDRPDSAAKSETRAWWWVATRC